MAELADALDSGSSESNFMQVQVLFPAPNKNGHPMDGRFLIIQSGNQDLNSEVVNEAPVGPQSRADRRGRRALKKKSCFPHQTKNGHPMDGRFLIL